MLYASEYKGYCLHVKMNKGKLKGMIEGTGVEFEVFTVTDLIYEFKQLVDKQSFM